VYLWETLLLVDAMNERQESGGFARVSVEKGGKTLTVGRF
jgi:hypothetical protein